MGLFKGLLKTAVLAGGAVAAVVAGERFMLRKLAENHDPHPEWRATDPHGEVSWVETGDGARLRVVSAGEGPPLLLLHGLNVDLALWSKMFDDLVAAGHRVITYDHRGHGESTVGSYGQSIDLMADDLKAIVEHFDVRDAVAVGHSMGGMVLLTFATRHAGAAAERLRGMVLVASSPGGVFEVPRNMAQLALLKTGAAFPIVSHPDHGRVLAADYFGADPPLSHVESLATLWAETPAEHFDDNAAALGDFDVRAELGTVAIPALVVGGTKDKNLPHRMSEFIASRLPEARLETFDTGHMIPWEEPKVLTDMVLGFAKERQAAT